MSKKRVTEYIDYRLYLKEYYEHEREHTHYFSHRYFAQAAGISSSSFLSRVIAGKRNLTRQMVEKFSVALKHSEKEKIYFKNLVLFNQAKTAGEKSEHYAVLRSLKGIVRETTLQGAEYDYFSNWYTPVIRELICIFPFNDNFIKIAQMIQPAISAPQARKAVALLLKLGLVERQDDGMYTQTEKSIVADSQIKSIAVRSYVDSMLKHSIEALHSMDKSIRHISSMTMGLSQEQYKTLVVELESFKERVKEIVTQYDDASQVYELNFAFFPVSHSINNSKDRPDA